MDKIEKAHEIVQKYHQEHLLKFYDKLEKKKKEELLDQILDTDFELLEKLYKNRDITSSNDIITPIEYTDKAKLTEEDLEKYRKRGAEIIKENKYAVVMVAGG